MRAFKNQSENYIFKTFFSPKEEARVLTKLEIRHVQINLNVYQDQVRSCSSVQGFVYSSLRPFIILIFYRTVCALLNRDPSIINDEDDASNTPLHLAALHGHSSVVKELLDRGAAIDARLVSVAQITPLVHGMPSCMPEFLDDVNLELMASTADNDQENHGLDAVMEKITSVLPENATKQTLY